LKETLYYLSRIGIFNPDFALLGCAMVKQDTVYKWISEKSMPVHRMGRLWKFKKDQVDQWVKAGNC